MHVESVAWATERKDVLYSAFYLGAVLWYLQFLKTRLWRDYSLSVFMGLLSILAKPMALSLPLILLLCDWFTKGSLKKEDVLTKIPYGLLIVPITWITYAINAGIVRQDESANILFPIWAAAFYLKKFFWPAIMVPHYLPSLPAEIFRFEYWSSVLMVGSAIAAFFVWPHRWLRFTLLWYILSIFFLLNFDHNRVVQVVADRYMYLPSAGFCFLLGYAAEKILASKLFSIPVGKYVIWTGLIVIAVFLSLSTYVQTGVWRNSLTLWNYTIKHSPASFIAFNNRGRLYERRGEFDLAKADYEEAIRLNPRYEKAYKNLAMVYEGLGDPQNAFAFYSKAIAVKANYFEALNNRALLSVKKGDNAAAMADYNAAITANPQYGLGYTNRSALFFKLGQLEQSREDCQQAIRLDPANATAHTICTAIQQQLR